MTGGDEGWRQKDQIDARPPSPEQIRYRMGGTCGHTPCANRSGSVPVSQMDAGSQRRCQPNIARHHQDQPACPAHPRQIASEAGASGVAVVPQNDSGAAAGQAGNRGAGIGKAGVIGEQPQAGQRDRIAVQAPGEEFLVHADQAGSGTARVASSTLWPDVQRMGNYAFK
jgi:hypothetical protein